MSVDIFFRFYAELNDLLPAEQARREFVYRTDASASLGEIMTAMRIPPGEIDLILVNGASVDFSYRPKDGDKIGVYPVFESLDISGVERIRARPLRQPSFVLDVQLGKLARYLRMLGFDSLYKNSWTAEELLDIAQREKRTLLTRSRTLSAENSPDRFYVVHEEDPRQQLLKILRRFDLFSVFAPFTRCLECNTLLSAISKAEILESLPPRVQAHFEEFQRCSRCQRVYWKGSHYERMCRLIETLRTAQGPG